jgi:hypothetical protein
VVGTGHHRLAGYQTVTGLCHRTGEVVLDRRADLESGQGRGLGPVMAFGHVDQTRIGPRTKPNDHGHLVDSESDPGRDHHLAGVSIGHVRPVDLDFGQGRGHRLERAIEHALHGDLGLGAAFGLVDQTHIDQQMKIENPGNPGTASKIDGQEAVPLGGRLRRGKHP